MSIYYVKKNGTEIFDGRFLVNPKLHRELDAAGYLEFDTTDGQPSYLEDVINDTYAVYEGDSLIFTGRPTEITTKYNNKKHYYVEGAYGFFNDTLVKPLVYQSGIAFDSDGGATMSAQDALKYIVEQHNSQVADNRKFKVIQFATSVKGSVYRKFNFEKSIDVLSDLRNELGGVMYVTYVSKTYGTTPCLAWVSELPGTGTQTVELGKNILDLSRKIMCTDVPSGILPVGPTISSTDSVDDVDDLHILTADESHQYLIGQNLTLTNRTDVNNGSLYITNSLVDSIGLQLEKVEFSSVKSASELLASAREYMTRKTLQTMFVNVNVADLHYAKGYESTNARIGFPVNLNVIATVYNPPIEMSLPISSMDIELDNAVKKISLGTLQKNDLSDRLKRDTSNTAKNTSSISDNANSIKDNTDDIDKLRNKDVTVDSLVTPDDSTIEIADVNVTDEYGKVTKYPIYQKASGGTNVNIIEVAGCEFDIDAYTVDMPTRDNESNRCVIRHFDVSPFTLPVRLDKACTYHGINVRCAFYGWHNEDDWDGDYKSDAWSRLGQGILTVSLQIASDGKMTAWLQSIIGLAEDGDGLVWSSVISTPKDDKSSWHNDLKYEPNFKLLS